MNPYIEHIKERTKNLFTLDKERVHHIIEILQYSVLYAIASGFFGISIDRLFPIADPNKSNSQIIGEILLQCMLAALSVYYLRKIVKIVPYIFEGFESAKTHKIMEYNGEIMIAIIFVGTQLNLIKKIDIIRQRF